MSRKSRLTISRERLEIISDCPVDLFDKIEATDEVFAMISSAESGDKQAIGNIVTLLSEAYFENNEINKATVYFLNKGIEANDENIAAKAVIYASLHNISPVLSSRALEISAKASINREIIEKVLFKNVITHLHESPDLKTLECLKDSSLKDYAEIYLIYRLVEKSSEAILRLRELACRLSLPDLSCLPMLGGVGTDTPIAASEHESGLIKALTVSNLDAWQDFVVKAMYEYCELAKNCDLSCFAKYIYRVLANRRYTRGRGMHMAAALKYAIEHSDSTDDIIDPSSADEVFMLECVTRVNSSSPDECKILSYIKDAAYTSEYESRISAGDMKSIDNLIIHSRNRYMLGCVMDNHAKRGNKHMWEAELLIDSSLPIPEFKDIKISKRHVGISRAGITIEPQKGLSQIIADGYIVIDSRPSPLIIDMILDISYVSTTKCENLEIKIKKASISGIYRILECQIFLY